MFTKVLKSFDFRTFNNKGYLLEGIETDRAVAV